MYLLWKKQYPTFLQEYVAIHNGLRSKESESDWSARAMHFQQLFDQYDLSMLDDQQRQECLTLVTDIRKVLGLVDQNDGTHTANLTPAEPRNIKLSH